MGVSFKVSKTGTRFRPKTLQSEALPNEVPPEKSNFNEAPRIAAANGSSSTHPTPKLQVDVIEGVDVAGSSVSSISPGGIRRPIEAEASFTLNLFPDGYSIKKPSEVETAHQGSPSDVPKLLHPYDRISESLFSAIECGRLPGDMLDDMPCQFVDGTLVCEVRDYRKCSPEPVNGASATDRLPIVKKVCLRMSLENVVKDIPLISDSSWTYGDLMEVESRIVKALQPKLCLDPKPKLERLCENPNTEKLNLDSCSLRKRRLRQMTEVTVTSSNMMHGKKICIDRVPDSLNSRVLPSDMHPQLAHETITAQNTAKSMLAMRPKSFGADASIPHLPLTSHQSSFQLGARNQRVLPDHGSASGAPSGQDTMTSHNDNINRLLLNGKRESQEGQSSPLSSYSKRARLTPVGSDGQQQQAVQHEDGLQGSDSNWKSTHPQITRGFQSGDPGLQKYPHQMLEGSLNQEAGTSLNSLGQQGLRYAKEEPIEMEKLDKPELNRSKNNLHMMEETNQMDLSQSRLHPKLPQQAFMRSNFSQMSWNNLSQQIEKDLRKEEQAQKRKSVQSPRVSAGVSAQSPLSSKSGEFSSGSLGHQYGAVASTTVLGPSQKEKASVSSLYNVGGNPTLASSVNDTMQRQQQSQIAPKRRTNSLPKTPAAGGVGSPASVGNFSAPLNTNSPPVGNPSLADQNILERFSKIEKVAMRFGLNRKRNNVNEYPMRKSNGYSAQELTRCLSNISNVEDIKDDTSNRPLSQSLLGGGTNACKIRVLNFVLPERPQGNQVSLKIQTKMIMSERTNDGTVAMHYGDVDVGEFLAAEDYFPTLPTTHYADLMAEQLCSLMIRDGHLMEEDSVQLKPTRVDIASCVQPNTPGGPQNSAGVEMQFSEAVSGQPPNEMARPNSGSGPVNSPQNHLTSTRSQPLGNAQTLQMSQGLLPGMTMGARPSPLDPQSSLPLQQLQQHQNHPSVIQHQHPQFQRSNLLLTSNTLSHLNAIGQTSSMQLGTNMINKPNLHQLLQQPQQPQQQQPQIQRKMMMGLGTAMGNMGNSMVGLAGLGNVMGMGGARGMGSAGMSAAMGPIAGIGNVNQNSMNLSQASSLNAISQQLRPAQLTQAQAALITSKFRMAQNRGGMPGSPQSSIGVSGTRQLNSASSGLSMLGQTMNRSNISTLPRTVVGPMGPPKLMTGMNLYMNPQQQFQFMQQQQQQQLQQQQQIQHHHLQQQLQQQQQQQQIQQQQQQIQQQQQQQQETTSPLQAVLSPPQVGSPSTMSISQQINQQSHQQQASPQQLSQRTPMSPQISAGAIHQRTPMSPQISAGAIHPLSAGNPEACPASPQLSSQTLGSVSSIAHSPMELQGVNKSNS